MPALPDLDAFTERVAARQGPARMFEAGREVSIARAPGRLDVLGGIADYSGSTAGARLGIPLWLSPSPG